MSTLKDNEWKIINDILLKLYYIDDIKALERTFLTLIRTLIPYNQSNFRVVDQETGEVLRKEAIFIDTEDAMIPVFYANIEPGKNYLKNLFEYPQSVVYCDSCVLSDNVRAKTEFYRDYLEPQGIPYACGIILTQDGKLLGVANLFRSELWGDFSDKELFILEMFKDHLTKILGQCLKMKDAQQRRAPFSNKLLDELLLTGREREITELILRGYTNEEIAEALCISISTTKKHVYNIFSKAGVNSRMNLIKKFQ